MENNNSNNKAVCIICGILTVFGLVISIFSLINGNITESMNITSKSGDATNIVVFVLIGYYAICGYRKPHGNLLKYIILIFAATFLFAVYARTQRGDVLGTVSYAIIIGLYCYVAGRLHKVKQNTMLLTIVAILLVAEIIRVIAIQNMVKIVLFTNLIIWLDICVAYFLRYKEHKEAGLMDAERK